MSKDIIAFENGSQMPAFLQQAHSNTTLQKMWEEAARSGGIPRIKMNGNYMEVVINGNVVARSPKPFQPIRAVILMPSPMGRTYYPDDWEEGSKETPTCYSQDGKVPAIDATEPQSPSCDVCPWNVPGTGGKGDSRKCRFRQSLAAWIGTEDTWDTVFQVNLSATAIFGTEANEEGYYTLKGFGQYCLRRKIQPHFLWVDLTVDQYADSRRIVIRPAGWVDNADDFAQIEHLISSGEAERAIKLGVLDPDQAAQSAEADLGSTPAHLQGKVGGTQKAPANKPVTNELDQEELITFSPFEGEEGVILADSDPIVDDKNTFWRQDKTGEVVMILAGKNIPDGIDGITEVSQAEWDAYRKAKEIERLEKAAEAKKKAEEEAARAAAPTGRRTRSAAPAPADETSEPAPAGRRSRGETPAETTEPVVSAGRRGRSAAGAEPIQEEEAVVEAEPAPVRRSRRADAAPVDNAPAEEAATPRRSRRADVATEEEPATPRRSRRADAPKDDALTVAQREAAQAPAEEQPRLKSSGVADIDERMASALDSALDD